MKPTQSSTALQAQFFKSMSDSTIFLHLLDRVPDVFYFVKDRQSRMIWVSHPKLERLSLHDNQDMIGLTDYEFFPKHVADSFVRDDRAVMESGKPLIDRVEIWFGRNRELVWSVTSKFPIHGRGGKVIGVIGSVRNDSKAKKSVIGDANVELAIKFIEANYQQEIDADDIAKHANLSPRHLLRRFKKLFGIGIHEFLVRTRIHAAADALIQNDQTIAGVASYFGFCDQSAFTRQFRAVIGMTPSDFQQNYKR